MSVNTREDLDRILKGIPIKPQSDRECQRLRLNLNSDNAIETFNRLRPATPEILDKKKLNFIIMVTWAFVRVS